MRRRRFILSAAAVVGLGFVTLVLLVPRSSAITRENALKIKPNMTLGEVEEVLGGPARDETDGKRQCLVVDIGSFFTVPDSERVSVAEYRWIGQRREIYVSVDSEGRVIDRRSGYPLGLDRTMLYKLRQWVGFPNS